MIHIFNRAELLVTPDVSLQARVCQSLAASGMEYTVRVVNRAAPPGGFGSRARTRTPSGSGAGRSQVVSSLTFAPSLLDLSKASIISSTWLASSPFARCLRPERRAAAISETPMLRLLVV